MNYGTTKHPNENIARFCWIAFVLMFFVLQACLWTYAISATAGDISHAVVSGYDEQALTWDEVKEAKAKSDSLGWTANVIVDQAADIRGNRGVTVQLSGPDKVPLVGVDLSVTAFHRAAAANPQHIAFREVAPGVYSSVIDIDRFGIWCFRGAGLLDGNKWQLEETLVIDRPTSTVNSR